MRESATGCLCGVEGGKGRGGEGGRGKGEGVTYLWWVSIWMSAAVERPPPALHDIS